MPHQPSPKFVPGDQVRVVETIIIGNPVYAETMPNSVGTVLGINDSPHWEYITKEDFPEFFEQGQLEEDQWAWLYWIDLPNVPLGNETVDDLIRQAKAMVGIPATAWSLFEFDLELAE